jgi:hypothetical protein
MSKPVDLILGMMAALLMGLIARDDIGMPPGWYVKKRTDRGQRHDCGRRRHILTQAELTRCLHLLRLRSLEA